MAGTLPRVTAFGPGSICQAIDIAGDLPLVEGAGTIEEPASLDFYGKDPLG